MTLISLPVLQDNYIWILTTDDDNHCLIVDPGDAVPVLEFLKRNRWNPEAVFLTHHHNDHVEGVTKLRFFFPYLAIYGPQEAKDKGVTQVVKGGENISLSNYEFSVLFTPGHTLGHICFFSFPYLFCGDTLFSGGCGRLLEGTPNQMYHSLQKINELPDDTLICCAHEYTLENMKFAISILPNNLAIRNYYNKVNELRAKNQKTLPSILKDERRINLFLLSMNSEMIKHHCETNYQYPVEYFAWLRSKKDIF